MRRFLIVCGLVFCTNVLGNPYWVESDMRVQAAIALNQLNRIQVFEDRISQVFGGEDISVETDTENGQIFIKAKDEKPIFLTLVTENGASIDLSLNPIETEAQTLVLKTSSVPQQSSALKKEPLTKRIIDLMKAMHEGAIDSFKHFAVTETEELDALSLVLKSVYQADEFKGEIWTLKNTSPKPQYLSEKLFATEPGILAVAFKTDVLEPNASTTLFKVLNHD